MLGNLDGRPGAQGAGGKLVSVIRLTVRRHVDSGMGRQALDRFAALLEG